ncbi:MAG: heme-binding protein [Gammaproteobacteria bacterium]|nr:heme-binding protein [Gammaproteobacteria bacterium]
MRIPKRAGVLVLALALSLLATPSHAIEEPAFEVSKRIGDIEVREYAPYVVAEVVLKGSAQDTGNRGFRILAGYIFGKNKGEQRLAMTAPVTQAPAPTELAMTAPVSQQAARDGYLVQFVLPRDVTLARAPAPLDPRIVLREEPPKRVAVIRYAGRWSDDNYNTHLAELETVLRSAGIKWAGAPVYSRYNPPITPWFLRRNEIWLQLADEGSASPR